MTLVAAYRPQGVPILIGDFLTTGAQKESSRKKIHLVGPNFCIGWTGRRFIAAPIFKTLFEEFGGKSVSMPNVEEFLTNRPKEELLTDQQVEDFDKEVPLFLIGWVIDDSPHCFLWNITYPSELFYEPFHVVGSGEHKFTELITSERLRAPFKSKQNNIERAIYSALATATELYSDENLERMNRQKGFGYGYELLYFDGKEFRYLDDVAYLGIDFILNSDNLLVGLQPYDLWYRYHSLGDLSILQVRNLKNGNVSSEFIAPVFAQKPIDASFEFTIDLRSNYHCIYIRLQTTKGTISVGSLVLVDNKEESSLYEKQENGTYQFVLKHDLIKSLFKNLRVLHEHRKDNTIHWGWGSVEMVQRITKAGTRIQFQIGQTDKSAAFGLMTDGEWDQNFTTMEFAIMCCADTTIQLYEKGIAVGPFAKPYNLEDTFSISLEKADSTNIIRYYQNDELLYTSGTVPVLPLKGVISAQEVGATLKHFQITHQ